MRERLNVLGVFAHPDDECIFGWPLFQNNRINRHLIVVASDRDNPERRWCSRRGEALAEVCRSHGISCHLLDFNSEFYRMPYRRADRVINDLYSSVRSAVGEILAQHEIDAVFCHNPLGEYGMLDHKLVFDMVFHNPDVEVVCATDIAERHPDWPSSDRIPETVRELYYRNKLSVRVGLNMEFYRSCKEVYERYGCWTWRKQESPDRPARECSVFVMRAPDGYDAGRILSHFAMPA